MTRDEVINHLTRSQSTWLDDACRKIAGHLWEDLRQEFLLYVMEWPEEKLMAIQPEIQNLQYWSAKVLIGLYRPKRPTGNTGASREKFYPSKFLKKHDRTTDLDISVLEGWNTGWESTGISYGQQVAMASDPNYVSQAMVAHHIIDDEDIDLEEFNRFATQILGRLPFYERVLFLLVADGKSMRDLERSTTIERGEISKTVKRVIKLIKTKWNASQSL